MRQKAGRRSSSSSSSRNVFFPDDDDDDDDDCEDQSAAECIRYIRNETHNTLRKKKKKNKSFRCDDDRREKPIGGRREPSARGRKHVRAEHVRARAIACHNPRGRRRLLRFGREEIRRFYVWHSGELFGPRGRAISRSHRRTGEDVNTHEQFVPHGTASDVGAEVSRDVVRR